VSSVTLPVFQLHQEHLTYCWNVSNVIWNVLSVIWNASSVNTIHVPVKMRNECVWCSMLKNFKGTLKIKGRVEIFLVSGVTCPSKRLLIGVTSTHL
jgi:uncharacterized protein YjaZ